MEALWWRRTLDQRLGTLTGAAIVLWTIGTAIAASMATTSIADAIRAERDTRAQAIAARLDRVLEEAFRRLDLIAAAAATSSASLEAQIRSLAIADSVVRIDADGDVLWTRSVAEGRERQSLLRRLPDEFATRQINATGAIPTPVGERAYLIVPARESDPVGGVIAAALNLHDNAIAALLASYRNEPYRARLLDRHGSELAASRMPRDAAERGRRMTDFLVAQAPVAGGAWQVQLSQPREQALAPVFRLRRVLVGSSVLLVPFGLLVAWGAARSIRRPVLAMTAAAEQLARGDFSVSVPPAGEDEIGRLAEALEQLRRALQADERRSRLLKRVITAQEEERRRIARELHDETTQQLTVLAMQLGLAKSNDEQTADLLARSRALVATMIDDVHRVIYDLRPSMLDDLGLLPAVRAYADKRFAGSTVSVSYEFPPALPPLPSELTTALYRVAQEAINNIARHAHASAVLIACSFTDHQLIIELEDDGIGFEPEQLAQPRESGEGLGLLGMRERLTLVGGRLEIESDSGCGTRVIAVAPLSTSGAGR